MRAVPRLSIIFNAPAFALQLRKNHGKPSVRASERCSGYQCPDPIVWSTWPSSSDDLDRPAEPADLGLRVGRRAQPSVSVSNCLSSVYSVTIPLHASGMLVDHHQEVAIYIYDNWYVLYVLTESQLKRTTRTNCHIYTLLPPDDGLLTSPKHV
jgi:hypothetical protein